MKPASSAAFPTAALRTLVVLPGTCIEGMLAVALPWLLAQALLGTVWLGAASAGVVLAALLGTLAAPLLERQLGNRRFTVMMGFAAFAAWAAAALAWVAAFPAVAYVFVLLAIAADAACDLGLTSRMPLLARLSAQRLQQFSGANWLWGIAGAAAGSVLAGWALAVDFVLELFIGAALMSGVVAVALAVLVPRASRRGATQLPLRQQLWDRRFWTPQALRVALLLVLLFFFAGPLDSLLLPAHLTSHGLPANSFGDMLAVLGLGLAAGLWWMQSSRPAAGTSFSSARADRARLVLGLLGLAGQLGLMLWLPPPWLLLPGLFVCAGLFAPLLPMLEAAMLMAAHPAHRTVMLAVLSTLAGVSDALGTASLAALMSWGNSTMALGVCLGVACLATLMCAVSSNAHLIGAP